VPPGHTDGDTVVWFTKSNVVHMGDDFFTTGFPFVDIDSGGSVQGVLHAIDVVLGQIPQDARVIPGHGDVSSVNDLRKYRSSLEEMVETVKKGLAAGKTVEQLQKQKVLAAWEPAWGTGFIKSDMFIATIARDLGHK
jgi:glyoxylase-like metal-dependent hydrolase (beta-lactamase superfamily II)